jgi:hypothetical protein
MMQPMGSGYGSWRRLRLPHQTGVAFHARCRARPMPGRGLVPPARLFPLFLIFTMALPALSGQFRTLENV